MISPWIDINEVNGRHWVNFWQDVGRLFSKGSRRRRPWLILFHEDGVVVRAVLGDRSIPSGFRYPGAAGLEALRTEHDAGRVVGLHVEALPRLWAEVESNIRYGDDYVTFIGHVLRALRRHTELGIDAFPPPAIPATPPRPVLDQLFNVMFPNGHCLAFYVLDEGKVFTSFILKKTQGAITLFTTDDGLGDAGIDATRWQADLPRLQTEITRRFGPLWAGFFCDRTTLSALARGEMTAAKAISARTLVRDPWPMRYRMVAWGRRVGRFLPR